MFQGQIMHVNSGCGHLYGRPKCDVGIFHPGMFPLKPVSVNINEHTKKFHHENTQMLEVH